MRKITKIVFHCSASDNPTQDIKDIRHYHKAIKGWSDVGYHYFIKKDGTIQPGRPISKMGAHVRGHNRDSIGVCFAGLNRFTKAQMVAAHKVLGIIKEQVGKRLPLYPHNHFTNRKTCPNFDVPKFLNGELAIIKEY